MRRQWLPMTYDRNGAWWVVEIEGRKVGFHCGEYLLMHIREGLEVACRIEMDRDWYVVMSENAQFYLKNKQTYWVEI
ncbi:DUF5348 domain-containing protein [Paenibacillus sp. YN15]|uniref:DUF5348 domain-containing protein n=1 Tax=Paenibacillus sp. YN15 TaxID=1742774 RepID=UPI000DCC5E6D|nr:DUF5348 domain-containing protein [Paenibacillus sp. YN15]RAU98600.1 hypothetical protein DQG13_17040 [Paenibacillus sp. YN15]